MAGTTGATILSCEISSLFYPPVPSEGQTGVPGWKPQLSAEVQREQREHASLEEFDLRRPRGQTALEE